MCEQLDEIKAILKETAEMSKKNKAEFDKYREETEAISRKNKAEFDRYRKEKQAEFDKLKEETEAAKKKTESEFRRIGLFWGEDTEATFEEATENGMTIEGKKFIQNATNYIIYDEKEQKRAEIDILMTNGKYILLIETKYNLPKNKTKELEHIETLDSEFKRKIEEMRKYKKPFLKDKKILKAFATRNLKKENYQTYLDRGYLLLTMQNNEPKIIGTID